MNEQLLQRLNRNIVRLCELLERQQPVQLETKAQPSKSTAKRIEKQKATGGGSEDEGNS